MRLKYPPLPRAMTSLRRHDFAATCSLSAGKSIKITWPKSYYSDRQTSFYPLFPAPHDLTAEVNLDVSHLDGLSLYPEGISTAPDVLITPCRLKDFAKVGWSFIV